MVQAALLLAAVAVTWVTHAAREEGTCPYSLAMDWKEFNGSCYWLSPFKDSWRQARRACNEHPGVDLASVHNLVENSFITEMLQGNDAWIGLNDMDKEGQFVWSNGETVDYLYWEKHQPNNLLFMQDCVRIANSVTGQWEDEDCLLEKYFVCKMTAV